MWQEKVCEKPRSTTATACLRRFGGIINTTKMKKNKTATIIIVSILIVSVSFAIACSKEKNHKSTYMVQQEDNICPKNGSTKDRFIQAICTIHSACNAAYQDHSAELLAACYNSDTATFYSITGIEPDLVINACRMSDTLFLQCLAGNPNYYFDGDFCQTCGDSPLPQFGVYLDLSNGHLPASKDDCSFLAEDFLDCHQGCRFAQLYQGINYFTCLDICLGLLSGIIEIH